MRHLLYGLDTVECAYYLKPLTNCSMDFMMLAAKRDSMRRSKVRDPMVVSLGSEEFLLAANGTKSGYPLLMENDQFSVQFGEFNTPSFFVAFSSYALWQHGALEMHERFMAWAESVGLESVQSERLSRVDFTFDYALPSMDFDEDNFVTQFEVDTKHRNNRKLSGINLGAGDLLLRIYDKCREIVEKSHKTWFYNLWHTDKDVWRIEWQVRKEWLRQYGIITFDDLKLRQGDLLKKLVNEHTTLRIKSDDKNRSRWPMHPLWLDLQQRVETLGGLGEYQPLKHREQLDERQMRIAVSVYGYLKRVGAIDCLLRDESSATYEDTLGTLVVLLDKVHDPLAWQYGVKKRADEMRLGQW